MLVTCKICKRKINRDVAYKITTVSPTNGKVTNSYFCSEAEWQAEEERKKKAKEDKDKVYFFICDMFGYEIQNTKFFDEWRFWTKLKSNEIIYKYLRENEPRLRQICDKPFKNEYAKIKYFSAVLKNSLKDFVPKKVIPAIEDSALTIDNTFYGEATQSLNKRRSLADLEDMF